MFLLDNRHLKGQAEKWVKAKRPLLSIGDKYSQTNRHTLINHCLSNLILFFTFEKQVHLILNKSTKQSRSCKCKNGIVLWRINKMKLYSVGVLFIPTDYQPSPIGLLRTARPPPNFFAST